MQDITVKVDAASVISQLKELHSMEQHYRCIPILIRGIQEYMPEPYRTQVLDAWDNERSKEK